MGLCIGDVHAMQVQPQGATWRMAASAHAESLLQVLHTHLKLRCFLSHKNQAPGGLKGKEVVMGSRGLRRSIWTPFMQGVWHGNRRPPGQYWAQGDGVTCTYTQPFPLVMNHTAGGCSNVEVQFIFLCFSHILWGIISTKRISPLRLFSLGKDGQGRSPVLCCFKVVTFKFIYVDAHVYQLREGKALLMDLL